MGTVSAAKIGKVASEYLLLLGLATLGTVGILTVLGEQIQYRLGDQRTLMHHDQRIAVNESKR